MEEVKLCQQQLLAHNETIPPKSKVVPFPLSICENRQADFIGFRTLVSCQCLTSEGKQPEMFIQLVELQFLLMGHLGRMHVHTWHFNEFSMMYLVSYVEEGSWISYIQLMTGSRRVRLSLSFAHWLLRSCQP